MTNYIEKLLGAVQNILTEGMCFNSSKLRRSWYNLLIVYGNYTFR